MDIVLLTDTRSGLNAQPVRITSIEENENGDLTFEGEEISIGTSAPPPTPPAIAVVDSITWAVDNSDTITSDGSQPIPGSPAVGITTMINNTLIIAAMSSDRGTTPIAPVSSVSSTSGLTWSKLDGVTSVMPGFPNHLNVEVWVAVAPTPVTNEYITFHLPAVVPANRGLAIAVEGVSTGSFTLDGAVLDNTVSAAGSGKPTVTMTTTNAHDILIYVSAINGNDDLAGIPIPAGFTYGAGLKNFYMLFGGGLRLGYEIVTSTQTGLVLTSAVGTNIPGICIAFALEGI
jgi:hypothetical protein